MKTNDHNIGFLLVDVSRLMRREFKKRLENNSCNFVQARILFNLSRHPGLRQVELADILEMQPISIVKMLDALENDKLIERRKDPSDRRAYQLYLTDAAAPHLDAIEALTASIRKDTLGQLSETETAILQKALLQIRSSLNQPN